MYVTNRSLRLKNPSQAAILAFFILFTRTVPPKSAIQQCASQVTEGDNVTLYCNATGNPPSKIAWTKSGEVLVEDSAYIISAINQSQTGIYECMAWNGIGNNYTTNCTVNVQCK